jgi:hypothetical protein
MKAAPALLAALLLAACAHPHPQIDTTARVPAFARVPYEPFRREAAIAIALREWRLFGSPVDDDPPGTRPPAEPEPERVEGLWQRVGEYWWLGVPPGEPASQWTGKHDATGQVFPEESDDDFAWSAAFIGYVMRIAGAGARFPYSAGHYVYIDAARAPAPGAAWVVSAQRPEAYAPMPGDLICLSRTRHPLVFDDLPAQFPGHCDIVTATAPGVADVVGGNVDHAVTLKHVPLLPDGRLGDDPRYPWFVVLKVAYDQ